MEQQYWSQGLTRIAGVDEAGRGPLAGPVVAAAVLFPVGHSIEGVDDSKKLTPKKREELLALIERDAVSIGIGVVDHETIDKVNILQASILAMRLAVEKLLPAPEFVLADGNSFQHDVIRFQNLIDGDARCFSIAAASIVAKVTRDRFMDEYDKLYPQYGFARHKGYCTREHVDVIKQIGFCEIHRKSFKLANLDQLELELNVT
ncbi:MAG: ribonuclease HII [Ignavibacteriales bacterium]|nr:ribonuclease HII [Ignavibacteriales bacterium]